MIFIDAESNRSWITCIMVVVESDWMWIQNLPNWIECRVKKNRVRTPPLRALLPAVWLFIGSALNIAFGWAYGCDVSESFLSS